MGDDKSIVLEVWGDLACFTRPEMKVERFSYPVMTPSAARGILDAIYCKPPEFGWRVTRIEILNPIKYIALRRNEVKEVITANAVAGWAGREEVCVEFDSVVVDATGDLAGTDQRGRTQRQTMALKNVRYRIHATIFPKRDFPGATSSLYDQAVRRIRVGKCHHQPCFGCREFVAFFSEPESETVPIDVDMDLGWMLYDVFDLDDSEPTMGKVSRKNHGNSVRNNKQTDTANRSQGGEPCAETSPQISVFQAVVKHGILEIPAYESDQVKKPR